LLDFLYEGGNMRTLETALKVSSLRHKAISNNIANIDTPLFKRSEVLFEDYLKNYLDHLGKKTEPDVSDNKLAVRLTNSRHIGPQDKPQDTSPFLGVVVRTVYENTMRTDGNNVEIDHEMADLAKNTIYYQAVAQRINGYFSSLRTVIENR
jgi:flagellar basal-body rod protein FlgB